MTNLRILITTLILSSTIQVSCMDPFLIKFFYNKQNSNLEVQFAEPEYRIGYEPPYEPIKKAKEQEMNNNEQLKTEQRNQMQKEGNQLINNKK